MYIININKSIKQIKTYKETEIEKSRALFKFTKETDHQIMIHRWDLLIILLTNHLEILKIRS